ncbi:putative protease [Candidatus Photodesmus blepharus]|uniref:Putative protease n=1 Tax=Candidatus Photodesmus blepharonis TaxID=1179155 RepID=A0A084CNR6_9GAMM|nr:putative protease [Candidatus Photodesmus blepharus]
MRYAFAYGADAVYAGQPRYSLRVRNNEFNEENLKIAINEAHALNKKLYLVCNIQPHNSKIKTFIRDLKPIIQMKPDAIIMSDPGLIMMIRERFPEILIHLSVQANAVNWATVKFWMNQGIKRVVLSRELSLEEIEEIRQFCPEIELEVFVHGALCMAYSGRCLLSSYINKRDPNQGTCTNACRWKYRVEEAKEDAAGQIIEKFSSTSNGSTKKIETQTKYSNSNNTNHSCKAANKVALLSGEYNKENKMAIFEDEHGTYIMNSKDLRAIQHVDRLTKMGIQSLKIEGRTKSSYYCARSAQIYRKAIDDSIQGKPFDKSLMDALENLAHRGYTEGFLRRHTHHIYQQYNYGHSKSDTQQFVGEFTGAYQGELTEVKVKNKFFIGDNLELMTPKGNMVFTLQWMENRKSKSIEEAKGDGHFVFIFLPIFSKKINLEYSLLIRNLT